mmetsp:Transcript_21638/g.37261  ORF Transcript_21638/g.37261 Transcript_21638/m.37261 type:complete len:174 (+) Transcript_21638:77-598(+)
MKQPGFTWFHLIAAASFGFITSEICRIAVRRYRLLRRRSIIRSIESQAENASSDSEYKVIFCVRNDLKMTKGKIAAQVGHATLGLYQRARRKPGMSDSLLSWEYSGQAKIAVQINSEQEAKDLERSARRKGLNTYAVFDAGRTQIAEGSLTVLAIGPAKKPVLDSVTGHLKLL